MNRIHLAPTDHLLEEYAALEYILLGDLRDLLEEPPDKQTRRWLIAVLDALLETLPREMQLQEEGGYLSEVLEQYPNWYDQVDHLHNEHRALYFKLGEFRQRIHAQQKFSRIADEVRNDLRDWMGSLTAHHRHQRRLVQQAFNLDVGTGD